MSDQNLSIEEDYSLGLEAIISDMRKYFRLFAVVFVLIFAAIFAVTYSQTPRYSSSATIIISSANQTALPGQTVTDDPSDQATIDSQVEILKSSGVAARVVKNLNLNNDPEFNPTLPGAPKPPLDLHMVTSFLGAHGIGPKSWVPAPAIDPKNEPMLQQAIIGNVASGLTVQRIGLTKVIKITFSCHNKDTAARVANEWVTSYMQEKVDAKEAASQQASGWLSSRIDDLRKQVEDAERQVQEYKISHNLLSADGATLTEQEISDLNRQLATVQVDQAESQARLNTATNQLQAGSSGDDVGEALNSPVVSSLRAQQAQVSAHLAELQSHYGPMHPEVIKAKNQLADINAQIQAEIHRIISNLQAQNQIQQQRTGSLAGSVHRAQGQLAANSKAMVKLQELQLNADSVRALYESYLDRFKQTETQSGIQTTNATLVSEAKVPMGRSSPKLSFCLLLAFVAATATSGTTVMVRRAFDSGIVTSQDVERRLGVRYLASIPSLSSTLTRGQNPNTKPHQYIVDKSLSVFAEGFRGLRASILYGNTGEQPKVIVVTSALPGEGKTTTSVCLAAAVVMAGNSVVVVDCDLRKRSVSSLFGKVAEFGLVEVLDGTATLEQAMQRDETTNVAYLPISSAEITKRDIFSTPAMDKLLADLREKYDFIILDTAPILPVVDTRILARKADFVTLLVRWRRTPMRAVQAAIDILRSSHVTISGTALTQVDVREQGKYGYGDAGYYFKDYKHYYNEN